AFALILTACAISSGNAQVLYGTLTGNVTDPSSAVVPNAKVDATNMETGVARTVNTDDRGAYLFSNVQAGPYNVTVASKSFRTFTVSNVQVLANDVRRVDVTLQIAQTTETVEITADAVVLQTDKADIHSEVSAQEVEELPYNGGEGKNFQS